MTLAAADREDLQNADLDGSRPLRRGDACLACRKRRIRCSAEKPACATCHRLKKECVYDTTKPISKIAKLKTRLAELENQVASSSSSPASVPIYNSDDAYSHGNIPNGGVSHQTTGLTAAATSAGPFVAQPINTEMPSQPHSANGHGQLPAGTINPMDISFHANPVSHPINQSDDCNIDMNVFMNSNPAYFAQVAQSTNPRPWHAPDPDFQFDFGILDNTMMNLSNSFDMTAVVPHHVDTGDTVQTNGFSTATSTAYPVDLDPTDMRSPSDRADDIIDLSTVAQRFVPHISPTTLLGPGQVTGGWFDPSDVPPQVRDHLLDIYFSNRGNFDGMFNIPRFYASLTLPLSKRPHPALMYAIYLHACRRSNLPSLKFLEPQFLEIFQSHVHVARRRDNRLMDVIKAHVLGAIYLTAKEEFDAAHGMTGTAIKLATSCGLHCIPTSVWTPPQKENIPLSFMLRSGGWIIEPPADAVELGIRIHTFWNVFRTDYSMSIAYQWEPTLHPENIKTPLPRPPQEYALGLVSTSSDRTMDSVVNPTPGATVMAHQPTDDTLLVCSLKILALLHKIVHLWTQPPETSEHPIASVRPTPVGRLSYGVQSLSESMPRAFAEIKYALDNFCDTLPPAFRCPWSRWDQGVDVFLSASKIDENVAKLWAQIGWAYLHLHNIRSLQSDNKTAILIARRVMQLIPWTAKTSTHEIFQGYDTLFCIIWNDLCMVIMREMKRLEFLGRMQESSIFAADFKIIAGAIKEWTARNFSESHKKADVASMNWQMLERLRGLSKEEWEEASREAAVRYT